MGYLVALNFVILAFVAVLVVGLLRAYAEAIRRLHELDLTASALQAASGVQTSASNGVPQEAGGEVGALAPPINGHRPGGGAVSLHFGTTRGTQPTLLAFLSAGCVSCADVWEGLAAQTDTVHELGIGRVVAITKGPKDEDPVRIQRLAGTFRDVVMSPRAHPDYGVEITPYFVLVGPDGHVSGAGTGQSWQQMLEMIREATADEAFAARLSPRRGLGAFLRRNRMPRRRTESPAAQLQRAEAELAAAGVGPGHPSLFPDHGADDA